MKWFLQLIAGITVATTNTLFKTMDFAYDMGGGSLLPSILGTTALAAAVLIVSQNITFIG